MRFMMALVVGAAVLAPAVARADGYFFNEGLGPGASVKGEMGRAFDGDGIALRVSLGRRVGPWAVEGVLFGTNLAPQGEQGDSVTPPFTQLSYGVDFRYYLPLSPHLEAYGKAGLHATSIILAQLSEDEAGLSDYGGRGYDVGAGIQWFIRPFESSAVFRNNPFARMKIGLFADYTNQTVRLNKKGSPTLDGELGMWTFGFGIGSDL